MFDVAFSTGSYVAWRITESDCASVVWLMVFDGEVSQDEYHVLNDNVDFRAIAEEAAKEFADWFRNGACYDDVMRQIADLIREDAAYKKMIAERENA